MQQQKYTVWYGGYNRNKLIQSPAGRILLLVVPSVQQRVKFALWQPLLR